MKRMNILTPPLLALALLTPMLWQDVLAADGRHQPRAQQHRPAHPQVTKPHAVQRRAAVPHKAQHREAVKFNEGWGSVRARDKAGRPVNTHVKDHPLDGNHKVNNRHVDNRRDIKGNNVVINNNHNHIVVPPNRRRVYHDVVVVRPYGHWYGGYGSYYDDNDAWKWLAFTAITLKILDNINEEQQREHEAAQVKATTAPLNQPITWNDGNASGSVTAVRDGTSNNGRYCREFQQSITVGGKKEDAFGTACQNPDGAWEIVSD